jgi:FAD/FMN-containing dehydrogenase
MSTTTPTVLGDATVDELAQSLRGEVVRPADAGYDEARAIWNGAHDQHPALIVRCAGAADVIEALSFARSHDLAVAVRGGGHSIPGFSSVDDGLVIDLSAMRGVLVDPIGRRVIAQGGCTWHDVDVETQAFGLATTGGLVSTTGIGGYTLGGGIGWLMRKHGLACDNLVGADVVTVDGRLVHASADEHADLFWALRGGGGNFGVVTAFEFDLHPVGPTVAAGAVFFKGEDAGQVARAWREWLPSAPDELTTMFGLAIAPPAPFLPEAIHGKPVALVLAMHSGAVDDGLPALDPLRRLAEPVADLLGPLPYLGMQSLVDALHPPGDGNYFKSHHLEALPDEAIDLLVEGHGAMPSPQCEIHVHDLRGAVAREPGGATAFPHRSAPMVLNVIGKWPGGGSGPAEVAWARDVVASMEPYGTGAAYVNYLGDDEDPRRLQEAYGADTYARLVRAKDAWDPGNLLRRNQNVPPSR